MAAEAFKDAMDAKGVTSGVLGMNTNVENEALNHRIDGFRTKIAEIAPELELTDTYYNGNDVETAQKNAENIISTYGDKLIGMYSGNNITGDGAVSYTHLPHLPVPGETVKGSMFKMGPGGKGFNQCVAAHKAGADVVMMTKIGTDTFANVMLDTMTESVSYTHLSCSR